MLQLYKIAIAILCGIAICVWLVPPWYAAMAIGVILYNAMWSK